MSERPTDPGHAEASDAVRNLPTVPAEPVFRERLLREFVSGSIASPASVRSSQAFRGPLASRRESWMRSLAGWWPQVVAGIGVAALLAISLWVRFDPGPGWQLAGSMGTGELLLDGAAIDPAAGQTPIRAGAEIATRGDLTVDLICDGIAVLQLAPGAEITAPSTPHRLSGRDIQMRVRQGEIRVSTGPRFAGRSLVIESEAGRVRVLGTTFAVICNEDSTCVCVLEGGVQLEPRKLDGAPRAVAVVPAGERHTVFSRTEGVRREAILPGERMKLEMLRAAAGDRLR